MAIGTTQSLPLGITVYDCRGRVRRRRLVAICTLCGLAAAGFAMADKARVLMVTKSATVEPAAESPGTWEAPIQPATVPETAPSPPSAAALIEPAGAPEPEPSNLPTIIRGAGIKPR